MQEQELFGQYELKGWQLSPRLYKIVGASVLVNLLAFFLMAQSNFLTGKTCDSPLASGVCSVLDALYVGSVIAESDLKYVDGEYQKTELENAEITFVNLTNYAPLEYPEGYFALANPDTMSPEVISNGDPNSMFPPTGDIPGITNPNPTLGGTNDLTNTTPVLPKKRDNIITGQLPKGLTDVTTRRPKKNDPMSNVSPGELPKDDATANADKDKTDKDKREDVKPIENQTLQEVTINRQPLYDLTDMVLTQWTAKEIDLNQQFLVVMNGALTADGKIDVAKSKWDDAQSKGDPKMVEIAKEAVESVGESGFLHYLRQFGVEKIKITLAQDNDKVIAFIESEQKSAERANSLSSQINNTISVARITLRGDDEKTLLSGAKSSSSGKTFILNFELPKPKAQEMINRRLQEAQAKRNQQNTSGSTSADTNQAISK